MSNEEKQAIEAMKTIQQYCDKNENCGKCIFVFKSFGHGYCFLNSEHPYDWGSFEVVNADEDSD